MTIFCTFIGISMTMQTTSVQLLDPQYFFFPLILGGFVLCTAALCVILNLVAELAENTEDHLYIENSSRN